jgi:ribosome biogenesis SPOUT family RNA methylase Rps3
MKYIIEHLEPELFEWCLIEYEHISELVGKDNLILTNIGKKDLKKLSKFATVYTKRLCELELPGLCVMSQYADKELSTEDKGKFQYLVFGGILGDNPAKKRTNGLISSLTDAKVSFEQRSLSWRQMPTDNAVYVSKKIIGGAKLNDLHFVDHLEIEIDDGESIMLDFRYIVDGKKVIISPKLVEYLRKNRGF